MKDELIVIYYLLSKCCNKVQHKNLERISTAKILKQKYFTRFWKEYLILTVKIANIIFFLSFLYIKGLDIKMSLISSEGYKNAGVFYITIKSW